MKKSKERFGFARRAGMTLIEVMASTALVIVIIVGALTVRYQAVRQAVRADAYETAGRVGQLLLEGWRSIDPNIYEPNDRFPDADPLMVFQEADDGPDVSVDGFTPYDSPNGVRYYEAILNSRHYYAALGYMAPVTTEGSERPLVIHVSVGFLDHYGMWDTSEHINYVKLTGHR